MKGVHLERNKPLQAPEAADGTTAPAVAAPLASGFAAYGGLAHMFTPPNRGMYFILRLTQLIVRPDSRLGALRYKIPPNAYYRAHSVIPA